MEWFEENWPWLMATVAWLLAMAAWLYALSSMIKVYRALQQMHGVWRTVTRSNTDMIVAVSARVHLLESRSVRAGVTPRNPLLGETPPD